MFEKWFAKYARAVSDDNERQRLYKKYKMLCVFTIIFICACAAFIISVFALGSFLDNGFVALGILFLMMICPCLGIGALCLWISFKKTYNAILKRPPYTGEMPEVTAYRQKIVRDKQSMFKKLWWAWIIFAIGVIGFIVCLVMEAIKNPDGENFTVWGEAAFWCLLIGALTVALAYIFYYSIQSQQGKTIDQQTAKKTAAIDAAQGRKTSYKPQSDPNLNTYKYIFPNRENYEQAESLRIKYQKYITFGILAAVFAAAIVVIALYAANVFNENTYGYTVPAALSILYAVMQLSVLLPKERRELNTLEKKQKAELESNPDYAKNLEWYKLYDGFNKFKGKIYVVFFIVGLVLGWVLGAVYPQTMWSLTSLAVILIGLIINNALVKKLRLQARPIECEINEAQKPKHDARFTYKYYEEPRHLQVYHDLKVEYVGTCFVTKDGGGDCTLYTGINSIDFDFESKRVGGISGDILCDLPDIESREIPAPENFKEGILYVVSCEHFERGISYNFDMPQKMYYDKDNHILQLGECDYTKTYLHFLKNAYAQLNENGYLLGIIVTDITE